MARRISASAKEAALVRKERKRSRKLGYSLTFSRHKRERLQSKAKLEAAKRLAKFVPELGPISHKTRLSPSEKARVTHYQKLTRYHANLVPVSAAQAKKMKGKLFAPGVRAIELRGTSDTAKVIPGKDLIVVSNGRKYILWALDRETVRSKSRMGHAGERAFSMQFPVEKLAELAEEAFSGYNVKSVQLWAASGPVGEKFKTLGIFLSYLADAYGPNGFTSGSVISDPGKWIQGIAIEIEGGKRGFGPTTAAEKRVNPMG